jgi:hypothetical protein
VGCGVQGGHRLDAAVLLIEGDVVARQDDPVEGDDQPDCGDGGAKNKARLSQPELRSGGGNGVRAMRCHVPSRS